MWGEVVLVDPGGRWSGEAGVVAAGAFEFATLEHIDWFNHRRRHGEITDGPGYTTPAAHEAAYYAQQLSGHQAETRTIESP